MAGDFNTRISEIRQDLAQLLGSLNAVEAELKVASADFAELAANASSISTLSTAIQKLSKFLGSNNSPFLTEIKGRVKEINTELSKLNVAQLQNATGALEANAKAIAAISRAQANTTRNLNNTKTALAEVRQEAENLARLDIGAGEFAQSLDRITGRLTEISKIAALPFVQSLNQLDPAKYNQTADSLDRIHNTIIALKQANISIDVSAAAEGQKLARRPIQPVVQSPVQEIPVQPQTSAPPKARPRTIQYAQEQGIDLSQVQGTGARGAITKEDVVKFKQTQGADPAAIRAALEKSQQRLSEQIIQAAKLDSAIEQINEAKFKALIAAGKQHGLKTSYQYDIAKKYLTPEAGVTTAELYERKKDFQEIAKNKQSDELEVTYLQQLRKQKVTTDLEGPLANIRADDTALIKQLVDAREAIQQEIKRTISDIEKLPELSIGNKALVAKQLLLKKVVDTRSESLPTSVDYILNKAAGRVDKYTGGTGAVDERLITYDERSGGYRTRGNGVTGANDAEFEANRESIRRAVLASPAGIAVIGSTGANAGGASLITGSKDTAGVDHIAVAFLDALTGDIRIREKNFTAQISAENKTGSALLGSRQAAERSIDEFAAKVDRLEAVPIKTSPDVADKFKEEFFKETETSAKPYSFRKTAEEFGEAGDTCATVFSNVAKKVGLLDVQARYEQVPGVGKLVGERVNVVTPHDVLTAVKEANAGESGLLAKQQGADLRFIDQIKIRLTDVFKNLGDNLKKAFESFKAQTKDVTFGDIFSYIKSLITQGGSPVPLNEAQPELSVGAGGIRQRAAEFSKNVYRPFQTGLTYFGAGLNSVQEIAKGAQAGGPGGLLDIAGGVIKGAHTVANANAYFNLGILPKGVGELFNQRRSETLLDIFETVVGAKTGYRRSSIDKNYAALKEQEAPLEARKTALKEAIDKGNLSPEDLTKAHNELASVTQELRELRQAISAYRRVIAEETKKSGGASTGKKLSEEALHATTPSTQGGTQFSADQNLLSRQAQESLTRFAVGTGFTQSATGGIQVANPQQFAAILKATYGKDALKDYNVEQIKGANLPGSNGLLLNTKAQDYADTIVHEGVHRVINEFENLPKTGTKATPASTDEFLTLLSGLKNKSATDVLEAYTRGGPVANEYFNRPNERYAYTGQALITNNKELEEVLQHIYGRDLYNQLVADLRTSIPDTFGDEALAILRQRFGTFQREFNAIFGKNPELAIGPGATIANNLSASANAVVDDDAIAKLANAADQIPAAIVQRRQEAAAFAGKAATVTAGIGQGVDLRPVFQELRAAFKENFGTNLQQVSTKLIELTSDIPQYQNLLIKSLSPNSANFARIAQTATELYVPQGTPQRRLYESFNAQGGQQLTHALIQAIQEPTKESFSKLFQSAKNVDIQKVVEQYVQKIFTEGGLDLKGGLIASQLFKGSKATIPELIGTFATQFTPKDITFRDELNARVRATTGRNIEAGSYSQQAVFDPTTGLQKFAVSARTADGAVVQLNAHIDEFGKKVIEEPRGITKLREAAREFFRAIPRQLADQFTYGITDAVQTMFRQLVGIQDELAEVANLLGVVGDKATAAKGKFLFSSVQTAVQTGQGFDEAIQTNLKNFKILGNIKDTGTRSDLANQISSVQLGAQTAFGITLEQGLEAIPAILSTIKDGMEDIADPTEKVARSVAELRDVMDEVVVAQRATGAQGDELITVYSRLAGSAKEYGLNSKQLLGITATSSVAIGRGSEETSNILRAFLEGTYSEANQREFAKAGIATKTFNVGTGQLENRSFEDILKEIFALSQDQAKSILYNQLLQSIAGPKLKPDIAKVVSGFGRNYATTEEQLQDTQAGTFEKLVGQKSQNLQGSLNKLGATGTQLFGSILVGTGAFDKLATLFDNLSESAVKLTSFLNDNQDSIKGIVNVIGPLLKFFTIGQLSKDLNIFGPIAKGINTFELAVEETKAKIIDFGAVGEGAPTGLTRTLKLALAVMKEMQEVSARAGETITAEFNKAAATVDRFNNASKGAQAQLASNLTRASGQYGQLAKSAVTPTSATVPLPELSVGPDVTTGFHTPIKQRLALAALDKERRAAEIAAIEKNLVESAEQQKSRLAGVANTAAKISGEQAVALAYNIQSETPLSDRIRNRISRSSANVNANLDLGVNTLETVIAPPQSRLSRIKNALQAPGASAGALAAPVAFDVLAGGTNKDNLINVGAGIAGGIAGAFAGGPFGATIGYSIAKGISDSIDLPALFGTSTKEANTFAEVLAEKQFNRKPPQGTAEEQQAARTQAAGELTTLSSKLGIDELKASIAANTVGPINTRRALGADIGTQVSSADVKHYLDIQRGLEQPGFFDRFKNNAPTERLIGAFGGNRDLLDLFSRSGLSNVQEFITQIELAAKGIGPLAEEFSKLSVQTQAQAASSAQVVAEDQKRALYQSAQDLIAEGQKRQTDLEAKLQNAYQIPYGLDKYSAFSPLALQLGQEAGGIRATSNKPEALAEAQAHLEQVTRSQESLAGLSQSLQQLLPLAQSLGLNTQGLEQRLYGVGAQGQQQIVQRFQPAIEADRFTQTYELQRSRLRSLQASDLYKAGQAETVKEVEALQKALSVDKARYDINKSFLDLLKSQSNALLDQTGAIESQNKTRQLLSPGTAGTPAPFTPASIFDTKGLTAVEINNAIDFALRKQSKLIALNPEYKKEFAKDQFLFQSGTDFKGVTGVNQGFVQEYLNQQKQQQQAPLEDLSQFSDTQLQKILERARSLQGQAEKLDPARAGKYDDERILILRKNNELLSQTGISQEFLKVAIQENTKSTDQLRGHYNLPSNYKSPTIFDYYDAGGREKGDKNFPTLASQGLVPLSFAQQLARELLNPTKGNKGAELSAIEGTAQPGAKPLFYPTPGTPGTPAIYSDVVQDLPIPEIEQGPKISDALQRYYDFKQRQIDEWDVAIGRATGGSARDKLIDFKDRQADLRSGVITSGPSSISEAQRQAAYNNLVDINKPYLAPNAGAALQNTTTVGNTVILPAQTATTKDQFVAPTAKPAGAYYSDLQKPSTAVTEGAEKTKTTLTKLADTTNTAKDGLTVVGSVASKTGTALGAIATALPAASTGVSSLASTALAFNGAVTSLVAKVQAFDLAAALRNANLTLQVTINGQAVPTGAAQVTVTNNSTAQGTNSLVATGGTKTGRRGPY